MSRNYYFFTPGRLRRRQNTIYFEPVGESPTEPPEVEPEEEVLVEPDFAEIVNFLKTYFSKINYFGKRASFFQITQLPQHPIPALPNGYSREIKDKFFADGKAKILIKVDDFGKKVKFENVSTFSDKKTKRVSKIIFLPFKMLKANKNFTIFQRL